MTVSAQTRANRVVAGRKAAAAVKAKRARRDHAAAQDPALYGPQGTHRGSAPVIDTFDTILARLRARFAGRAGDGGG